MPLAPVPPLPELPELPSRSGPPFWLTPFLAGIAVLSLAANLYVAWTLRNVLTSPVVQPDKFAAAARRQDPAQTEEATLSGGRLPRRAGPEQRLAALLAVSGDADRSRRLLDTLTPEEGGKLGQTLAARPPASDRNGALTAVLSSLAATQPARAVALLEGVQEGALRSALARQLAEVWTAKDAAAAANWLAGDGTRFLDPGAAAAPLLRAVTQWSTFDPEAATRFAAAQAADRGPMARALSIASRAWGQTDAAAALAWADALPPADGRRPQARASVWEGWTERDPPAAGAALRGQLYAGGSRPPVELAAGVGRRWAQADPNAAAQWALSLPTNGARGSALTQVAATWAQADAPAAAQWAATLPPSSVRAGIWKEIVNDWADGDADATGTWLGGLPPGRDHDEAVGAYLPKVEPTEPEKALAWVSTVGDPGLRAEQMQSVLSRWVRRDAVAARNWAAANGVPILPGRTAGP